MLNWFKTLSATRECFACGMTEEAMVNELRNYERRATIRRGSMPGGNLSMRRIRSERWNQVELLGMPKSPNPKAKAHEASIKGAGQRLIATMRFGKWGEAEVELARRMLLSPWLKESLNNFLPFRLRQMEWVKVFSTDEHGGLSSLYQRCREHPGPSVIVVMDTGRHVFGGFVDSTWELQPRLQFFGNGECFLFKALPQLEVYRWTRKNGHMMLAARDSLALGGGGHFGLWLDSELEHGNSNESSTFDNLPLGSAEEFEVVSVEVWGFEEKGSSESLW